MKVGDYVRYRCAYDNTIKIKKINAIVPPDNLIKENYYKFDDYEGTIEKCIIKSSPNIIDLIKKKDIVVDYNDNIYRVVKVWKGYVFTDKENKFGQVITLVDYQIKSIVTCEQFLQMEYKVGE